MTTREKREKAIEFHKNNTKDCGGAGRAFELECARANSRKCKVSEQNETDVYIKMLVKGKVQYVGAECKTNGGRIDGLENGSVKDKYIIYRLDYVQKLKNRVEERHVPAVVIPADLFMAMLRDINGIKAINKNGVVDGYGIQVSKKDLYKRLTAYIENYGESVLFDNEKIFEDWFFEGLEL